MAFQEPESKRASIVQARLQQTLDRELFEHSVRVAEVSEAMASRFAVDPAKAYLAGLLHDCAKSLPDDKLLQKALVLRLPVNEVEKKVPYLLHSKVASRMAEEDFGIADEAVLQAIDKHTIGSKDMEPLDKIVYIADMIEPARTYQGLERIKKLAEEDLDKAFEEAYVHSLEYLIRARKFVHPDTVDVWNSLIAKEGS